MFKNGTNGEMRHITELIEPKVAPMTLDVVKRQKIGG